MLQSQSDTSFGMTVVKSEDQPLISVVIPAYNAESWIHDAVNSVYDQTYSHWELIIVDDGSTDRTRATCERLLARQKHKTRLVTQINSGVSASRNRGVSSASGEMIAFLDADDVWTPDKLSYQVDWLLSNPSVGAVGCHFNIVSQDLTECVTQQVAHWDRESMYQWLLVEGRGVLLPSTLLVRITTLRKVGLFSPDLGTASDLDLAWRLVANTKVDCIPAALVGYRLSADQMHKDMNLLRRDYRILFRSIPELQGKRVQRRVITNIDALEILRSRNSGGLTCWLGRATVFLGKHPIWIVGRVSRGVHRYWRTRVTAVVRK